MPNSFKYREVFITTILLLLFSVEALFSQSIHRITGIVFDKETGESIPTVHVYISQTTTGTTTKHDGTFGFSTNLAGMHTLVFSYVGYKTETKEINFYKEKNPYFEVELTPDPIELAPLEVTASNKEWQENFEIFRKNFIGETSVANQTKIRNPWVISFESDEEDNLIAKSDHPIEIINQVLGYNLKVDLVEFRWPKTGDLGFYLFYISYSELEPENNREIRLWKKSRSDIYKGSFQHFLKSLYNDDLRRNDFVAVVAGSQSQVKISQLESLNRRAIYLHAGLSGLDPNEVKGYQLKYPIDVLYGKKMFNINRQLSRIIPMAEGGFFLVTKDARLANPVSLRLDGVWSQHRVANLLPTNYSPDK